MNLRYLFLLLIAVSAKLVFAAPKGADGVTMNLPLRFNSAAVTTPDSPTSRTVAAAKPAVEVPGDDDDDDGSVTVPQDPKPPVPAPPKPKVQAPTPAVRPPPPPAQVDPPPPRPPAPIPAATVPHCNTKDPSDPSGYTIDWKAIENSMSEVVSFRHSFNPNFALATDETGSCQIALEKKTDSHGAILPHISVTGNTCQVAFVKPAKACQIGNKIKFVIDTTRGDGKLLVWDKEIAVEFTKIDALHWQISNDKLGETKLQEVKLQQGQVAH